MQIFPTEQRQRDDSNRLHGSGGRGSAALCARREPARRHLSGCARQCRRTQDQFTVRFDHHINDHQNFSFYYYYTDEKNFQPFYNFQASGANIPGFGTQRRIPLSAVQSESYLDDQQFAGERSSLHLHARRPADLPASASDRSGAGFVFLARGAGCLLQRNLRFHCRSPSTLGTNPQYGITTGLPANRTGVPFISVTGGFAIGNGWEGELPQVGNSFMWADNLTWVKGNHTANSARMCAALVSIRLFTTT